MRISFCRSMLIGCLTIALLAPAAAVADDDDDGDDDNGVACPCWTAREARKAIKAAFASPDLTDSRCSFEDSAEQFGQQFTFANFLFSELGELLASIENAIPFCSVENLGLDPVMNEVLTEEEARECVQILAGICARQLR